MIARIRALLARTDELAAARAEIRQLHKDLAAEQAHCTTQVARIAELEQRPEPAEAARCECGGDTELYWRTRAHWAEQQARQDRDSVRRMEGKVEYWRGRFDQAEHQVHIAEQLGRAS